MQSHASPNRSAGERPLTILRGGHRVGRARERNKEGIPLGVNLDAVMARERLTQSTAVLSQRVGISFTQFVEQPRRSLDVREQEGHSPARELRHGLFSRA
ncbi:MAG TPA: hypothetical protein VJT78_02075 [Candidatus Dormibacteraeota bacterium]|nr:hypothetical protein [Candidatus Dormibacteraeota bacterium]